MEPKLYAANKLRELRTSKNMSQEEVAEQLTILKIEREKELVKRGYKEKIDDTPITRQTISKYELGSLGMNQDILFDISKIFKTSINNLFPPIDQKKDDINLANNNTIENFKKIGINIPEFVMNKDGNPQDILLEVLSLLELPEDKMKKALDIIKLYTDDN